MKKLFFLPALAAMMFSSCSSDEPTVDNPADQGGDHYMTVKLRTAGLNGSRAAEVGNPEFEDGTDQESAIAAADLWFFFYDDLGNAFPIAPSNVNGTVSTNMVTPTSIKTQIGPGNDAEIVGELVLGSPTTGGYKGQTPSQVLVVANGDKDRIGTLENMNLSTILTQTSTAPTAWGANAKFLMTSSVYFDGTGNKIAAVNVKDNIKTTKKEAEEEPAIIYIERVAAKVRASWSADNNFTIQQRDDAENLTPAQFTFIDYVDGDYVTVRNQTFTAEINGWQLINKANRANAFKALPGKNLTEAIAELGANDATNWVWNDDTRYRSYWAVSNTGTNWQNPLSSFKLNPTTAGVVACANGNYTVNTAACEYCYENTNYAENADANGNLRKTTIWPTGIMVKATIKKDGAAINMYRYAGDYYTKGAIEHLIKTAYISSHGDKEEADLSVEFVDNNDKSDNTYTAYVIDGATRTPMNVYNSILWWKDGVTTYYLNVKHLNQKAGVVRNHIYDYHFDALIGLGVPGDEPDTPTLTESFLAARIYILNWHVVSNHVTLE